MSCTQQCIAMFDDVPHHRQRGRTLTAMLQRVLDEPDLRHVHETGTWDNILDTVEGPRHRRGGRAGAGGARVGRAVRVVRWPAWTRCTPTCPPW